MTLAINQQGICPAAIFVPSPHCDERPAGERISLVVVHGISLPPGDFGGPHIDRLFLGRLEADAHPYFREVASMRVSSHFLIRRDGALVQYVPCSMRAWHAGTSSWKGRERCNDFSIGIELEGSDDVPYAEPQYETLAALVRALFERYGAMDVAGHSDIAPDRKTDPGPYFDWPRLRAAIGPVRA
ncbi:MAG TPA: 1,6-anhydro-N-acetylmuramyl-L-alanine amidase AmpD [Usitatibacter sp.]|nr:1,6-anhydro-N-acetylmuramyl-L-alanine amidase AmpD [Usitatibacter sp.]